MPDVYTMLICLFNCLWSRHLRCCNGLLWQLLGKGEVLAVFREVEAETDVDESVDEMLFPAFLEVVARCALMLGKTFLQKMEQASPTEIPFLKSFLSVCCPDLQVTTK